MKIDVRCPECKQPYRVPGSAAGKRIACKKCGGTMKVPIVDAALDEVEVLDDQPPQRSAKKVRKAKSSTPRKRPTDRSGGRPAPSDRPARKRRRRGADQDVVQDFEEVSEFDDPYGSSAGGDDDEFSDLDEFGSYGSPAKNRKRAVSGRAKWVWVGLLILAISTCVRTAGFGGQFVSQLLISLSDVPDLDTIRLLAKADMWLQLVSLAGMIVAYVFLVMGPDRDNSQGWAIAAVVLGLIACAVFFFLQIKPFLDEELPVRGRFGVFQFLGRGSGLWEIVFKQWVLVGVYLAHMLTALTYVRSYFGAKASKGADVAGQTSLAIVFLGVHAAFVILMGLMMIFIFKVIIPAARESREPPSDIWPWIVTGCSWLAMVAFLVFLILEIRLFFMAQAKAR